MTYVTEAWLRGELGEAFAPPDISPVPSEKMSAL